MKYTKEILESIVRECNSFAEVLRKLGLRQTGGSQAHIKNKCAKFGIDTSHFLGQAWFRGKSSPMRVPFEERLVCGEPLTKVRANYIRRAMLEVGFTHECALCGQLPQHNGKLLTLEIDHINGMSWDNRRENLRFLCPNCHSQTETFGNKNKIMAT